MLQYLSLMRTTSAYQALCHDFEGGVPAHAYLLQSQDAALLKEFGIFTAMLALCKQVPCCLKCRTCKNILAKVHPDVQFLPEKTDRLGVEEIGQMVEHANLRGMESDKKVYIIDRAHEMLEVAQNKLLKILEEPPTGVMFVLLAENQSSILTTVRSRLRLISIAPLETNQIKTFLMQRRADSARANTVSAVCDGQIGKAVQLYENPNLQKMYADVYAVFKDFTSSAQILKKTAVLLKYKESLPDILDFMMLLFRDCYLSKVAPQLVRAVEQQSTLNQITANFPQAALIAAIDSIKKVKEKLYYNCNATVAVDALLLDILEERNKCRRL